MTNGKTLSPPSRRRGLKSFPHPQKIKRKSRLLRGGVDWNGYPQYPQQYPQYVASFAEAWIEINAHPCFLVPYAGRLLRGGVDWNKEDGEPMFTLTGSPPSRRRGLKFKRFANLYTVFLVASFAEAWIEMYSTTLNGFCSSNVASFAEAWIEICTVGCVAIHLVSPPSRRRGLKWGRIVEKFGSQESPPSRRRGLKLQND